MKPSNKQAAESQTLTNNTQRNQQTIKPIESSTSPETGSSIAKFGSTNRKSVFSSSVLPKTTINASQFRGQKTTPQKVPTPTPHPQKPIVPQISVPLLPLKKKRFQSSTHRLPLLKNRRFLRYLHRLHHIKIQILNKRNFPLFHATH